jgi:hypothetical protein
MENLILEQLIERTRQRRAAGLIPNYALPAAPPTGSDTSPAAQIELLKLTACPHLGDRLPGQPCGSALLRCNKFGDVTTRVTRCDKADRFCGDCPDHPANRSDC